MLIVGASDILSVGIVPRDPGLSRNDSVGREGMASRILSQDEARARRGPMEGP
jgi:hypothetical protein